MRSCPTNALLVEAGIPPLHLRRIYLAKKFIIKKLSFSRHPLIPLLGQLNIKIQNSPYWRRKTIPPLIIAYRFFFEIPIHRSPSLLYFTFPLSAGFISNAVNFDCGLEKGDVNSPVLSNLIFQNFLSLNYPNKDYIYTDASKTGTQTVGAAFYHSNAQISCKFKLNTKFSIFSAECIAVLEAIKYVLQSHIADAIIISDSKSLLSTLSNPISNPNNSYIISLIKYELYKITNENYSVSFIWCPSHIGVRGNETVDLLAKEGALNGENSMYQPPYSDLYSECRSQILEEWQIEWDYSSKIKGSAIAALQPVPILRPWFDGLQLDRHTIVTIGRLRTGHNCLPRHLNKIKIKNNAHCACGHDCCDENHVLLECPLLSHQRAILYRNFKSQNVALPINMSYLLSLNNINILKYIAHFFKSSSFKCHTNFSLLSNNP
ncbi:uncharacterized protein LOC123300996 [Chrysoperla carnea]|uniref:uncharacterized protein LOC123300996 n=1 Tax=Chrysoperla carnea TaxID=189513 RepID=UPI001D075D81|nr:uncharacterized protein LOC123300996 [Chrysoperla carnea]